ncbi:MAG: hypothetical protein ACFE9I_15535 [Candidatus Hermodarchaeota archaeon]
MQIFEVVELQEFPFMVAKEIIQGQIVGDILNDTNLEKVYILVDHDTKRIWTYDGPNSSFKVQIYGGILAGMLKRQLRLFYRLYSLNMYSRDHHEFQELLQKPISGGRAKPIKKIVDVRKRPEIKIEDFEGYEFLQVLKSAEKKIDSIMKKESINELTIERQYLSEIFNADLIELSKSDGIPIFKPFVIFYFMLRGIQTDFIGKSIKLRKVVDEPPMDLEQIAYLFSKINLYLEAGKTLENVDDQKSKNFKKLYADTIIREGNLYFNRNEFERAARNYETAAHWASLEFLDKELTHEAFRSAINSWISACRVEDAFRVLESLPHQEVFELLKDISDKICTAADYLVSKNDFKLAKSQLYLAIDRYQREALFDELKKLANKLSEVLITLFKQQIKEKKNHDAKSTYDEILNMWESYNVKKVNLDSTLKDLIQQFLESKNIEIATILIDKLNSRKLKMELSKKIKNGKL